MHVDKPHIYHRRGRWICGRHFGGFILGFGLTPREAYERSLRPVSDWRGNTHWQAA